MATNDSNGENQEKQDNAEDNFGLPDIEFKPLDEPKKAAGDEPTSESASETTRETSSISSAFVMSCWCRPFLAVSLFPYLLPPPR